MNCRYCKKKLEHIFADLGLMPLQNSFRSEQDLNKVELTYPLRVMVCDKCWLVQTFDVVDVHEMFNAKYIYHSSTSTSWLDHAEIYSNMIQKKLSLNSESFVIEVASNDGYLLKNILKDGIPCLGIEPADSTANVAENLGIPVLKKFFGEELGKQLFLEGKAADLIVGNNVFAHVPDINDFTFGLKAALKPEGTITLEFQHFLRILEGIQFDTLYFEHFSYLSLTTICEIFESAGLSIWDVEELSSHGGSLRVYGCHAEEERTVSSAVQDILEEENLAGIKTLDAYQGFQSRVEQVKNELLEFLLEKKRMGIKVAGYGAAAKGNTSLNFAGIKPDLLSCVYDLSPSKHGKYLPGSHIPILSPKKIQINKPDLLLILAWNHAEEIVEQQSSLLEAGTRFFTCIPEIKIF